MKLHRIGDSTDICRGGTNSGIYHLSSQHIIVIDPGLSESRGKRFSTYAMDNNKEITHLVATHEHSDHIGAFKGILPEFKNCKILADRRAKQSIEAPDSFFAYINGGAPNDTLRGFFRPLEENIEVAMPMKEGTFTLEDHTFEWLHFGGHSIGSGGIITPDKVLFLGDTLIPSEILSKFQLPLLYDISKQYDNFKKLETAHYDHCVVGHGKRILSKEECVVLANENKLVLDRCIELIEDQLKTPTTKEQLMAVVVEALSLQLNYKEYLFGMSSVSSILSYLIDKAYADIFIDKGQLYYTIKNNDCNKH